MSLWSCCWDRSGRCCLTGLDVAYRDVAVVNEAMPFSGGGELSCSVFSSERVWRGCTREGQSCRSGGDGDTGVTGVRGSEECD